jgi:VCBS repeat-containing protein
MFERRRIQRTRVLSVVYHDAHGTTQTLTADQISAFEQAFSIAGELTNTNVGNIDWTYAIPDNLLDFLGVGEAATVTATIQVNDQHGGTVNQDVTVTVNGANDLPIALPDIATVQKGATVNADAAHSVLTNDGDPDIHDVLTVRAVNGLSSNVGHAIAGAYGTLTLNANGSYSYIAKKNLGLGPGQNGVTDKFSYTVDDGHGGVDTSTLTVAVVRDITPPIIGGAPISATVTDDVAVKTLTTAGAISFSDADLGDQHKVSVLAQSGDWGKVTAVVSQDTTDTGTNGAINWTYKLNENTANALQSGQTHTDQFTVTIDDGDGGTATQEVAVIVKSSPYINEVVLPRSIDKTWNQVGDPSNSFMEALLGTPQGTLTQDNDIKTGDTSAFVQRHITNTTLAIGGVKGLDKAVQSLEGVLSKIQQDLPDLFDEITANGMLNIRYQRPLDSNGNILPSTEISNHAWGIAIDFKINGHVDSTQGHVFEGIADIIPYFNAAGWVSGAAWVNQDNMHFEVSEQTLRQWYSPTIQSGIENTNKSVTISGSARPGIPVSIWDGSALLGVTQSAKTPDGTWTFTTDPLSSAIHTLRARP